MAERSTYDHTPVIDAKLPVSDNYHQSKDNLAGLPQTTLVPETELEPNLPNIFTVDPSKAPTVWIQNPDNVPLHMIATKADVGGIGGHVETSPEVQATGLDYVLRYNRLTGGKSLFRSLIATHAGDDLAFTGIVDEETLDKHKSALDELLWDAFNAAGDKALELGHYGPKQDLIATAFTGNIHGSGPASVDLPLPQRDDPEKASQTVLIAYADKTEPGAYNHLTTGAYMDPVHNTGLLIASSAMANGYVVEIIDVDTKAQAIEAGASPANQAEMDAKMTELGERERFIRLSLPEDYYDVAGLTMSSSRFVIARIFTKDENGEPDKLGVVVSAERLHNIPTAKGFTYGGKDDPVMLSLAQGDWPAPGEITSPLKNNPIVAGDCRGSHRLHIYPAHWGEQTSFWSGPIIQVLTASINLHTGRIGSVSDQLAKGTPWDFIRNEASRKMKEFRDSTGYKDPGTLPPEELEYQEGYKERMGRLNGSFSVRKV